MMKTVLKLIWRCSLAVVIIWVVVWSLICPLPIREQWLIDKK